MESRRRIPQSKTSSPNPNRGHSGACSNGILVIGDDAVSKSLADNFDNQANVIFVRMGDSLLDSSRGGEKLPLEVNRITDLFEADIGITPTSAIVATSEDSQNLLVVLHLQYELDIDDIVVRVNEPQYIDAFADLSVDLVDVASIIGSVLVERFESSSDSE